MKHALKTAWGNAKTIAEKVEVTLQIHEMLLGQKHGRDRMYAGRTRPMLKKYGARGMLVHLKEINSRQTGLRNMVEHGYAHMTFERIIIDQADKFPAKIVAQARTDLEAAISAWSPSRKRAAIEPAAGSPRTHPGAE